MSPFTQRNLPSASAFAQRCVVERKQAYQIGTMANSLVDVCSVAIERASDGNLCFLWSAAQKKGTQTAKPFFPTPRTANQQVSAEFQPMANSFMKQHIGSIHSMTMPCAGRTRISQRGESCSFVGLLFVFLFSTFGAPAGTKVGKTDLRVWPLAWQQSCCFFSPPSDEDPLFREPRSALHASSECSPFVLFSCSFFFK